MRRALILVCLLFAASASAIQVGQTRDAIVTQYGSPVEENHAKNTAIYRQGPWKVDVTYKDDSVLMLTFTKVDPLTEAEITSILAQNADVAPWQELNMGTTTRHWQGRDVATAQTDRINPRSIRVVDTPFRAQRLQREVSAAAIAGSAPAATPVANRVITRAPLASASPTPTIPSGLFGLFVLVGIIAAFTKAIQFARRPERVRNSTSRRTIRPRAASTSDASPPPRAIPATDARLDKILGRVPPNAAKSWTPPKADEPTLDTMGWQNFELLVGELFRRKGYSVEITSGLGADGGKDLTLHKDAALCVVQCKNLACDSRVTAAQMRDFFGLITAETATKGFFVTSGYFSADAKRFAEGKPITLIDRVMLEERVEQLARPGENLCDVSSWIDTFVGSSRIVDPACPRCEGAMKLKRGALGKLFWSCATFPHCRGSRDGREPLLGDRRWQGG
ncbi:MAG: restriction endonuclease [Chthoniobacterales bacterium]